MKESITHLKKENEALQQRLSEAEELLEAIRNGEVDAIVTNGAEGEKIYSLHSAETPYRIILEEMNEGAITISSDGLILFSNRRFSEMVNIPLEQLPGSELSRFFNEIEQPDIQLLLKKVQKKRITKELIYKPKEKEPLCLRLSFSRLHLDLAGDICVLVMDITELKKNEEFTNRIIASSQDCIKVLDLDGNLIYLNEGGQKTLEIEDLNCYLNKPWINLWKGKERQEAIRAIAQAKNGKSGLFTGFYRTEKRTPKWWDVIITPILDADGQIEKLLSISRDITERIKIENELKESENRFRELINALPQLFWTSIPDGSCDYISRQWIEYTGIPENEQLGYGWLKQIHPDDEARTITEWKEKVKTIKPFDLEFRIRKHDGQYKWFKTRAVPMFNSKNKHIKWFSSNTDIDDIKKAEVEMDRLNRRLLLATESAGMGVWDWDIKNDILTWDDGMFKLYGIEKTDFGSAYASFLSMLHPEDKTRVEQDVQLAIAQKKLYDSAFRTIDADSTIKYLKATAVFEYDEAGKPIRMIGVNWDITAIKKAEAEIKLLNEDLEKKIVERTRQLEASNKELESFSYSVAHDLRAPLRAVNSYAQILKEDHSANINADGRQVLENISYNANKMGALIDELLTFSRLGRKEIQKTAIDMNAMVQSIVQDFKETTTVHAVIHIGMLPIVQADYTLIHQVLVNLLSNAIKYSSKKEHPVVEISAEQQGSKTVFAVKDNGAGFDMQFADKLFGVFQRLHSEQEFEGNGVGLAIVQRIISKHGGQVWAEAKENMGATFYFTLS